MSTQQHLERLVLAFDELRAERDALLAVLQATEAALGNNLQGLTDLLDLRIRQKDAETLRRLAELNAAWVATARVIAKAGEET
jgi:hypothetical protein